MAYWLLPALAVFLALSGYGTAAHGSGSSGHREAVSSSAPGAGIANPEYEDRSVRATASRGVEPSPKAWPAAPRRRLDLHIYGISHHTDREGVRRNGVDNELNYGLGLAYELHNDNDGAAFFEAGFFRDSGRNWAKFAGPGYQFKLGDSWRLGAALLVLDSRTYNNGRVFVTPIPMLTYDFGMVKLNAIYAPRFQRYNNFAVFGFYFSIPLAM